MCILYGGLTYLLALLIRCIFCQLAASHGAILALVFVFECLVFLYPLSLTNIQLIKSKIQNLDPSRDWHFDEIKILQSD